MNASRKARHELSASNTRTLIELKSKTQSEISENGIMGTLGECEPRAKHEW